jgi:hypothetical protein
MGNGVIAPSFLTLAVDGGKWSDSRLRRFAPGPHWTGGWVGPRATQDFMEERNISCPCRESNKDPSAFRRAMVVDFPDDISCNC